LEVSLAEDVCVQLNALLFVAFCLVSIAYDLVSLVVLIARMLFENYKNFIGDWLPWFIVLFPLLMKSIHVY